MSKIILFLLLLSSLKASAEEIPWYFDNPETAQKASINAKNLVIKVSKTPIIIAVIDSGVNSDHPSLKGKVVGGYDMVSAEINPRGTRSPNYFPDTQNTKCPTTNEENAANINHGTEVASVIAGNGVFDVKGVNASARILSVRSVGPCEANYKDLIDSLWWSAGIHVEGVPDNLTPAKIINISMAGGKTHCSNDLQEAIDQVIAKGILIVSSAGNTFGKAAQEPSICKGVIGVGSVNPDKSLAFYSPKDPRILIYAPGGGKNMPLSNNIVNRIRIATYDEDIFGNLEPVGEDKGMGTSYSSPMVAGILADIIQYNLALPHEIIEKISNNISLDPELNYRIMNYEKLVHQP